MSTHLHVDSCDAATPQTRMRALVADDDRVSLKALAGALRRWDFDVVEAADGQAAWDVISGDGAPSLAIIDWMMPGMDGTDVCRRIRQDPTHAHMYVLLLTSRDSRSDIVAGLEAGADDYLVKPFDVDELRARVNTGMRILKLQQRLAEQIALLQESLASVRELKGLLPICSYCKRIRDDHDYWQQVETYIGQHSGAKFSHGICPSCYEIVRKEFALE